MRRTIANAFALYALLVVCACRPAESPPLPSYCYSEASFTEQLVWCAGDAGSREGDRTCRHAVQQACGITETEAGAR